MTMWNVLNSVTVVRDNGEFFKAVMLLTYIQKALGPPLSWDSDYVVLCFLQFSPVHPGQYWDNTFMLAMTPSFHILADSFVNCII
jgi:hypothetical protein